jgi:ABC-type oligopeptide transport system ATPase subunit
MIAKDKQFMKQRVKRKLQAVGVDQELLNNFYLISGPLI